MKALGKISLNIVFLSALLFSAIAAFVAHSTKQMMVDEARKTVESVVKNTVGRIDRMMTGVETAVKNSAWIVGEHLDDPDYGYRITRELVENNPYIVGSAVAYKSGFFPAKGHFFAPYTHIDAKGEYHSFQLGREGNDYFAQDWYSVPVKTGKFYWCEPYFDEGGGKILMSTYSVPIKDDDGNVYAILTADLSLDRLQRFVAAIRPYPDSYAVLTSAKGEYLVPPPQGVERERGSTIAIRDRAENGWTVEIVCPVDEILEGAQRLVVRIIVFSVTGLAFILLLSWFYSSRLQRAAAERQRMESDLAIANKIQNGMLPKDFPAGLSALLRPAREVGGDVYDFVVRGDKLYFLVGDASGKGVPAALFSFMAGTAFRQACSFDLPPSEIVRQINNILTRGNEMSMFVTVFVGVIDRRTLAFSYCNGGHNPPAVIRPDGVVEMLPVRRNIPCGVLENRVFEGQETALPPGSRLLVYTDGVTEAMTAAGQQYGEVRLKVFATSHAHAAASGLARELLVAVDRFVAGAEQSDDITIMALDTEALKA